MIRRRSWGLLLWANDYAEDRHALYRLAGIKGSVPSSPIEWAAVISLATGAFVDLNYDRSRVEGFLCITIAPEGIDRGEELIPFLSRAVGYVREAGFAPIIHGVESVVCGGWLVRCGGPKVAEPIDRLSEAYAPCDASSSSLKDAC